MPIVIRCCGFAGGKPCPHAGEYLKSFDHEAYDGQGYGEFSPRLSDAMRFKDFGEALEFYRKSPIAQPLRSDGKPNRPMTAMHAEFTETEDKHDTES